MIQRVLIASLALCSLAIAGDKDFDQVVHAIEKHYGVARTHIPLIGVANLFLKGTHPQGISGFKIATFEDLPDTSGNSDFLDNLGMGNLTRMVRVRSNHDGEVTYIYAAEAGKSTRLLIATLDNHEATVVEVKADASVLVKLLADPANMGKAIGSDQ